MKVKSLLAAFFGVGMLASMASADFVYTTERKASGTAGFELIQFYIRNDGANGSGTLIQSTDYTIMSDAPGVPLKIMFGDFSADEDGVNDANITGSLTTAGSFSWVRTNLQPGSALRLGTASPTYWDTTNTAGQTFVKPNFNSSTMGSEPETDPAFQNVKSIRIAYSLPGSGVSATSTNPSNTNGQGYFAAVVMVPTGTPVRFLGQVAGPAGSAIYNFNVPNPIPEPATIGLLGLGMMAILSRRNRKTA